jgi:cystathionine gamma-synthase
MASVRHPLGEVLPSFPHGTVVSLPTLADVDGYERRDPRVWSRIRAGYPRFVLNEQVARARDVAAGRLGWDAARCLPLHSPKACDQAVALAAPAASRKADFGDWALLEVDADSLDRVAAMVKHAGLRLGSRVAERWLAAGVGQGPPVANPTPGLERHLFPLLAPADSDHIRLAASGMNAVAAALHAARAVQLPRGRRAWLQLGWLYVDTAELLRKTLGPGESLTVIDDVADLPAIEAFFREHRGQVAAVVAELPNNPRLASPDVGHLTQLALAEGALRILDPSSSGLVNVDLLPWADLLVTSLTKYSGHRGDLLAGLLAVNPASVHAAALREATDGWISPLASPDLVALDEQLGSMEAVARAQNRNAARIADFLSGHPGVSRVLAPDRGPTAAAYHRVARGSGRPGSLVTFDLKGELADFYDRVGLVKGPSFGLNFTLLSPFLWLSHHALVTNPEGRARIRQAGLSPDLIRLSLGTEPPEVVEAALDAALRG